MSDREDLQRIDRDRKRREAVLLALLLLLGDEAEQHGRYAIRTGHDPVDAARNVWIGNDALDLPGLAPVLAEAMADANAGGFRRGLTLAGESPLPTQQDELEELVTRYEPAARQLTAELWRVIEPKLIAAITRAQGQGIRAMVKELGLAFDAAGFSKDKPQAAEANVERLVVKEYNAGMYRALIDPKHHLAGFVHRSVLDDHTTEICRARDGLTLKPDNPYWKQNFPPLHWGCRSVLMPLFGEDVAESTTLPTEPPAPGFGLAPSPELGSFFGLTR